MNIAKNTELTGMRRQRLGMMAAICMGAFISHFTAGIMNVSLPFFINHFQTELAKGLWITTGYLLVITALLPVMGKLGDRYGFRRIHNLGYVIFTVGSILVAFSPNLPILLALRVVQGIGAAMFQATNIALITIHMPKEQRGRALGILSTAVALGGMTGPIAGGLIAEWFSWQWLFLIHVPVAIVATVMAYRYIPSRVQERKSGTVSIVGAGLFMVWITLLLLVITNGSKWGWMSTRTMASLMFFFLLLVTFLLWERRQKTPFLPLRALRIPAVAGGLIVSCASFILSNTLLVLIPFYLMGTTVQFSSSTTGYIMAAYPIALAFAGPLAGYWSDRYGSRQLMLMGLSCMGSGFVLLLLFLENIRVYGIAAILCLIGLGMGLIASPNNSYIMQQTPREHVGSIGGIIALTRNAGMVFGSALGLGMVSGEIGQESPLQAFKMVFGINIFICMSVIILMVVINRRPFKSA
ncbi:MFS transporter [Paenibacillus etheri]|uniref:MFS transporter n=1 Tax=Paenibacillus etheri TaxID=1306852 RepID=A0A0W1B1D4_9BACL|nr:MFS transporter [Paenibacillus etheri]KTD87397.1 MFS transporter [Paenibacillus etheri]